MCPQVLGEWGGVATYLTAGSRAPSLERGDATLLVPFALGGGDQKHEKPKDAAAEALTGVDALRAELAAELGRLRAEFKKPNGVCLSVRCPALG